MIFIPVQVHRLHTDASSGHAGITEFFPRQPLERTHPSMCQGLVFVSGHAENHYGDHGGGGSWGRHDGHKQKSATAAGRALERKSIQPTENELVLTFTEHLFRLSNMAPSFSAVGSRSPQHSLVFFGVAVHGTGQGTEWWWGELAPPSEASSSAPHLLSLVFPQPES